MLAATGVVVAFVPIVVAVAWLTRRGLVTTGIRAIGFQAWGPPLAAGCSIGAAAIHAAVVGEHLTEYLPAGLFFGALAAFQFGWGFLFVWRSTTLVAVVGFAVNAATIGLWVWSRTVGFPLGSEPGAVEPVGYQDTLASVLETALLVMVGIVLWERVRGPIVRLSISQADSVVGIGLGISAVGIFTVLAVLVGGGH